MEQELSVQKTITVGVHASEEANFGIYNMLSSFGRGLYNALGERNADVRYTQDWVNENKMPQFSIGFNVCNMTLWEIILAKGVFNIMWTVDSVFYHNLQIINHYRSYPKFTCICLSDDDEEAINYFMPDLKRTIIPLAIDPQIWYSDNKERPKDIVFLASIRDPEEMHQEVKDYFKKDKRMYYLYQDMYKYALANPSENFWKIYNKFGLLHKLDNSDYSLYAFLLSKLTYAVSYQRRIELVKTLSDYNVEVYGNGPWEKFITGKVVHKGAADIQEAVGILSQSKIAFNLQPMQIMGGIHDRIMNSSASGALVFTDKNQMIYDSYGESLCYFNPLTFEGLADEVKYYLENDEAREEKAEASQKVTLEQHTWKNRVELLL